MSSSSIGNAKGDDGDNSSFSINSLLHAIVDFQQSSSADKVLDFVQPADLEKELVKRMSSSGRNGKKNDEELLKTAQFVLSHSVDTSHPLFLNQLYGGPHPTGLAAAYIVEKMNTNA
jgi:hypothetical protein